MDNLLGHKTALNFLLLMASLLSTSLQSAIQATAFEIEPVELFIKKQVAGASGMYKLMDANTRQLDGICSFNSQGRLDQNRAVVFNEIALFYGVGNADIPGAIAYTTAPPVSLANAELVISQEGKQVFRSSIRTLYSAGTELKNGDNYLQLPSLRLLRDEKDVTVNIHFPADAPALAAAGAGTTPYVYLSIKGIATRKK